MEIKRGDIFYIQGDVCAYNGYRFSGRPAVIVSEDTQNNCSDNVMVCFLTSNLDKIYPSDCRILCKQPSKAQCNHIYTIMTEDLGDYIKSCTEEEMRDLDKALLAGLGINAKPAEEKPLSRAEIERDIYMNLYDELIKKVIR